MSVPERLPPVPAADVCADDCRRLWASVLRQALRDAYAPVPDGVRIHVDRARSWIGGRDYMMICQWLGIDADAALDHHRARLAAARRAADALARARGRTLRMAGAKSRRNLILDLLRRAGPEGMTGEQLARALHPAVRDVDRAVRRVRSTISYHREELEDLGIEITAEPRPGGARYVIREGRT